jgi:hypothetical protein
MQKEWHTATKPLIIAWPKGEKIKTLVGKISYIFPQLDFCALFFQVSHNFETLCDLIKIIREKI